MVIDRDSAVERLRLAAVRFRLSAGPEGIRALTSTGVELIQLGFDTPHLRVLASGDHADVVEVERIVDAALGELGLDVDARRDSVLHSAAALARDFVAGRLAASDSAHQLWRLYAGEGITAKFPEEFVRFAVIADGVQHLPEFYSEADLLDAARRFLTSMQRDPDRL